MAEEVEAQVGGLPEDQGEAEDALPQRSGRADGGDDTTETAAERRERVRLEEIPEFREYQSNFDRRLAQEQAERRRLQEQLQRLEQQGHEARMANMDDYERANYLAELAVQRAEAAEQTLEQMRQQQQIFAQVEEIRQEVREMTGVDVPIDQIDLSGGPIPATRSAYRYAIQNSKGNQARQVTRQRSQDPAHQVDLGGGTPRTTEARLRRQMQQALKANDSYTYLQLKRQASEQGLQL